MPITRKRASGIGAALVLTTSLITGAGTAFAPAPAQAATVEVDDATTSGTPRFEFSGAWTSEGGLPQDNWFAGTETYANGLSGQTATLHFEGTRAQIFGAKHPNHGIYSISVDGGPATEFDAHASTMTHRQLIADTGVLTDGAHTVTIGFTGRKNAGAEGFGGQIDSAVVTSPDRPREPLPADRWNALPQPNEIALSDAEPWDLDGGTRIFVPREQQSALQREADRLSAELAAAEGIAAPPIVVGDAAQIEEDDIVLRTGDIAGTDSPEAYSVEVTDRVVVTGESAEGVFRGTRQVLQNLVAAEALPAGTVQGWPSVDERSLHLDAARKFYSAEWIEQELRDLAYVGINTFQFHFSENEGFRVESDRYPQVVSDEALTKDEVRQILALAEDLHIEVVPSLNMPGHLQQVLNSFPELQLRDANGQPVNGALDFTKPEALELAFGLVDEYMPLFPESTVWNINADEFIDFERVDLYPSLKAEAERRFGAGATAFDLLEEFSNTIAARVRAQGFTPRVWNDGMFRSEFVTLDDDIQINWWTNWSPDMAKLQTALDDGRSIVNFNDSVFYYVLGENAGYTYPTAAKIWEREWHPGVFPTYSDNGATRQQVMPKPYSEQLLGASFAIWSDRPSAQTQEQVSHGIRSPLRAMSERSWNAGSAIDIGTFASIQTAIGRAPGIAAPLDAPGSTTVLDGGVVTPPTDPIDPTEPVDPTDPTAPTDPGTPSNPTAPAGDRTPTSDAGDRLARTGAETGSLIALLAAAAGALALGGGLVLRARQRRGA